MLRDLKREVARDLWNLSRDDHDAIEIREQFIRNRYLERA